MGNNMGNSMENSMRNSESNRAKVCVLVCAGQLFEEDKTAIKKFIEEGAYLLAVDGGADYCHEMGLAPDLYLGDFDSVSEEVSVVGYVSEKDFSLEVISEIELDAIADYAKLDGFDKSPRVMRLPKEKDDTDTLAALKEGISMGFEVFYIFGGGGGRLDHTLANIQCLLYLKRRNCNGTMISGEETIFVMSEDTYFFSEEEMGILSLFSMGNETKGVTITGMKYPLENALLTNDFPIGISNEFIGQKASVSVKEGELLVVKRANRT